MVDARETAPGKATPEQYVREITIANDGIINQRAVYQTALLGFPKLTPPVPLAFGLAVVSLVLLAASFWGWLINPLHVYDRLFLAAAGFILLGAAALGNADGNVVALMPHPERAAEELLGSTGGRLLFESIIGSGQVLSSIHR